MKNKYLYSTLLLMITTLSGCGNTPTEYIPCTFSNYDGSVLSTVYVAKGKSAVYDGSTPFKPSTSRDGEVYDYEFTGWDKSLDKITEPTTFTAQFKFKEYKVVFENYNGQSMSKVTIHTNEVTYSGKKPYRESDENNFYVFTGWDKKLDKINEDTTIKAQYEAIPMSVVGTYPQTKVSNESIVNALNKISNVNSKGYIEYMGSEYAKVDAKPYRDNYRYSDNSLVTETTTYFKVEPIKWSQLYFNEGKALVVTENVIDCHRYAEDFKYQNKDGEYANNYKRSEIREYINNDFFNKAFNDKSYIASTIVINKSQMRPSVGSDSVACIDTVDRVFLLSYAELNYQPYYFKSGFDRLSKATDYAIAKGVRLDDQGNAFYWTRSPYYNYTSAPYGDFGTDVVYENGEFREWTVDSEEVGVRPAVWMYYNKDY